MSVCRQARRRQDPCRTAHIADHGVSVRNHESHKRCLLHKRRYGVCHEVRERRKRGIKRSLEHLVRDHGDVKKKAVRCLLPKPRRTSTAVKHDSIGCLAAVLLPPYHAAKLMDSRIENHRSHQGRGPDLESDVRNDGAAIRNFECRRRRLLDKR